MFKSFLLMSLATTALSLAHAGDGPFRQAEESTFPATLSDKQEFAHKAALTASKAFAIANNGGSVSVIGTDGNTIRISGTYHGKEPAKLHLEESGNQIKISVEYPKNTGSSGGIGASIRNFFGGSVGGNGVTVHTRTIIDGVEVSNSGSSGGCDLTIEIPHQFMAALIVNLLQGDISVKNFPPFETMHNRSVILKTNRGDVNVTSVYAPGGISETANQGDLSVTDSAGPKVLLTNQGDVSGNGNVGGFNGTTNMGDVSVEGEYGHVRALTNMGDITLNNPDALSQTYETNMGDVKDRAQCSANLAPPSSHMDTDFEMPAMRGMPKMPKMPRMPKKPRF